jgi:xylan 1,4-beta-xylosidase
LAKTSKTARARATNYATGEQGTPLDFVAFHAKGSPRVVGDHVQMGIANQLRTIETAFARFASYPELRDTTSVPTSSSSSACTARPTI